MSTAPTKEQKALLTSYGFQRAEYDLRTECGDCPKVLIPAKQWWRKVNVEYDEWDCSCLRCALAYIDSYESFDFEEWKAWQQQQNAEAQR